jgi:hypothetical protein
MDIGPAPHSFQPRETATHHSPSNDHGFLATNPSFRATLSESQNPQPHQMLPFRAMAANSHIVRPADDFTRATTFSNHPQGSFQQGSAQLGPQPLHTSANHGLISFLPTAMSQQVGPLQLAHRPDPTHIEFANLARAAQRHDTTPVHGREGQQSMDFQGDTRFKEDVDTILEEIAAELEVAGIQEAQANHTNMVPKEALEKPEWEILSHTAGPELEPTIEEPLPQEAQQTDVSIVARKIIESVGHEDEDKWKNSNFLALMRDFRDGKKVVVGDEIHDVNDSVV